MIEIKIDDKDIVMLLKRLSEKASNMVPAMKIISQIMRDEVPKNFEAGGKPKWKPSKRAMREGGKTLVDTARLMRSISPSSTEHEARVGTNVEYAAIHQFGGKTKAHIIKPRHKAALFFPGLKHPVKSVNHPGCFI